MTDRPVVLLDFGASRIKGVVWSGDDRRVLSRADRPAVSLLRKPSGEVEGNPEDYWAAFEDILRMLKAPSAGIEDVWVCSEMHGFLLADAHDRRAVSAYISWQDQRDDDVFFRRDGRRPSDEVSATLLATTGLRLRRGLPIIGLARLLRSVSSSRRLLILNLVEWLLFRGGSGTLASHATLNYGSGLVPLDRSRGGEELLIMAGVDPQRVVIPPAVGSEKPLGEVSVLGQQMRLWGGVGDLQAALHGIRFPEAASVFINLGTGSQVGSVQGAPTPTEERRLLLDGKVATVVTHIPSGRALNLFAALIDNICAESGGKPIFWRIFCSLSSQEVLAASANFDLATFESAWRYSGGGSITGLCETYVYSPKQLIASLARSWLDQYRAALSTLPGTDSAAEFVLGGGLSRRAGFVKPALEALVNMRCLSAPTITGEETLDGLVRLLRESRPQ